MASWTAVALELEGAISAFVDSTSTSPGRMNSPAKATSWPPESKDCVHRRKWLKCTSGWLAGLESGPTSFGQLAEVSKESETFGAIDAIVKLSDVQESQTLEEAAREFEMRG